MARAPDPKEIKILSDILALVLDEQPGHATSALERLRLRARRDSVTGGALKNLFNTLAVAQGAPDVAAEREKRLRQKISTLETRLGQTERDARTAQARLSRCQTDMGVLHLELATTHSQRPWRYAAIVFGVGAGLLVGIASTELYHGLTTHPPIDRASYLR